MADPDREPPGQRLPPLITQVPVPEPRAVRRWPLWLAVILMLLGLAAAFGPGPTWGGTWLVPTGHVLMGLAGTACLLWFFAAKRWSRIAQACAAQLAQLPEWEADPLARALRSGWKRPDKPPGADAVQAAIGQVSSPDAPRARIICLGVMEVPEVGELRFEPRFITPTQYVGRRLWLTVIAIALLALWAARRARLLPAFFGLFKMSSFLYFFIAGGAVAAAWIWRTAIRPTYVRLAPGIVQVVRFPFGKGKPKIDSYPMSPGTLVIVHRLPGIRGPRTITLLRGEQHDDLPIWQMGGRAELMERFWQALLSTAPTPPLSDEDLLG
ncbi:MAG: hypothetical protein PVJ57_01425 [Phycisphaerae bacterium]|jgi:hypothetical protein